MDKAYEGIAGTSLLLTNKFELLLSTFDERRLPNGETITYCPDGNIKMSIYEHGSEATPFYHDTAMPRDVTNMPAKNRYGDITFDGIVDKNNKPYKDTLATVKSSYGYTWIGCFDEQFIL